MLPPAFCARMQRLLAEDYPAFLHEMTKEPPRHAYRVNPCKAPDAAAVHAALGGEAIPYAESGYLTPSEKIGTSPYHHAGAIYSQDPGAMATVAALAEIDLRGARVLDVCAAPGGKSAQLAAAVGREGALVLCEYVPSRCKILVGNVERLGIPNALIRNTDASTLAADYPDGFDLTLVDAPCSGEGMFRKSEEARAGWSVETVRHCAARQKEILAHAARTVRPGGYLLYATCTFSEEENEEVVLDFLASHPAFSTVPVAGAVQACTAPGLRGLHDARRFYPHLAPGEGQFFALMRRSGAANAAAPAYRDAAGMPKKEEHALLAAFFADACGDARMADSVRTLGGKLILPPPLPLPARTVFAAGVLCGEVRGRVFFPHHQLFSAYGQRFRRQISLTANDPRLPLYLHGDVIPVTDAPAGYACVQFEGCPLGGAKVVEGIAKNLYPKGLRQ